MTEKVESESPASEATTVSIKPRYETPQILPLNALTRGQGTSCTDGTSPLDPCLNGGVATGCSTGNAGIVD